MAGKYLNFKYLYIMFVNTTVGFTNRLYNSYGFHRQ